MEEKETHTLLQEEKKAGDIQRNDELIVIMKPELPEKWDYDTSVKSMKGMIHSWANLTEKMIKEFSIAREILSSQGKRTDIKTDVPRFPTWEQYCKDVGISKRQANRITDRYVENRIAERTQITLPEKYTQVEKVEEKTEETKEEVKPEDKTIAPKKTPVKKTPKEVGEEKMLINCPRCKQDIYFICMKDKYGAHTHTLTSYPGNITLSH